MCANEKQFSLATEINLYKNYKLPNFPSCVTMVLFQFAELEFVTGFLIYNKVSPYIQAQVLLMNFSEPKFRSATLKGTRTPYTSIIQSTTF